MANVPIKQMDLEQLKDKIQEMEDTIAMMKRHYDDVLYDLDMDNLSPALRAAIQNRT